MPPRAPPDPVLLSRYRCMLTRAISAVERAHGYLLSSGEAQLLKSWRRLSVDAQSAQAYLVWRSPRIRLWSDLGLSLRTGNDLVEHQFAEWSHLCLPLRDLALSLTRRELQSLLASHDLPTTGAKPQLAERAEAVEAALRSAPRIRLRHRRLFLRIVRLYCCRTGSTVKAWELSELGLRAYPDFPLRGSPALFSRREDLLESESLEELSLGPWTPRAAEIRSGLERNRHSPLHGMSPAHQWLEQLIAALKRPPEGWDPDAIPSLIEAADQVDPWRAMEALPLAVRALSRSGRRATALSLATKYRNRGSLGQRIEARTAECSALGRGRRPPPIPVREAATRRIRLTAAPRSTRRPRYECGAHQLTAEEAVCWALQRCGRRAIFGENRLWRTLFSALFADILVKHLPGPARSTPMDFGFPSFFSRAQEELGRRLSELTRGMGSTILQRHLEVYSGLRIGHARMSEWPHDELAATVSAVPGSLLSEVMDQLAREWRDRSRGFPDILVLPQRSPHASPDLPEAIPCSLPASLFWIEVKGPGDCLRPPQKAWHHRLIGLDQKVEIWELRPAACAAM